MEKGRTMRKNRRKVYMAAGHHTTSLGTGRKEFHPKKPRPGLGEYIQDAGRGGALTAAMKSVLAGTADVVLAVGVEVQNTVKAVYGADILGGAGWYRGERKKGHAYFFPSLFSDRAGAYFEKYGRDKTRRAFARWYRNAVGNARPCDTAQECHNACEDLAAVGLTEPHPRA